MKWLAVHCSTVNARACVYVRVCVGACGVCACVCMCVLVRERAFVYFGGCLCQVCNKCVQGF